MPLMRALIPLVATLGIYILIGWVFYLWNARRRKEIEAQEKFLPQLLEKFQSPEDLTQFFESPTGEKLIRALSPAKKTFRERMLFWLNIGIVLTTFGTGMILLGLFIHDRDCMVFGFICMMLGAGMIIATAISHRLARQWKIDGQDPAHRSIPAENT